jgi:3-deoxy-D-manno-octulosonic-acid transferase
MYRFYRLLTIICSPFIPFFLSYRYNKCKEDKRSIAEKTVTSFSKERPAGTKNLIWLHGASVGEAQSSLILIKHLLDTFADLHILVTTGTLTSAKLMEKRLPERSFHQFCPLDQPEHVKKFMNYWHPDWALWMESELWPNMLLELKQRNIPAILVNGHMSPKSFTCWSHFPSFSKTILNTFDSILCQTENDKKLFDLLGAKRSVVTDNIKYSAEPLTYSKDDLSAIQNTTTGRNICLYASTHEGEEDLACKVHERIKQRIPDIITIIVPRHPERRDNIAQSCSSYNLKFTFRGENKKLPDNNDDIYIADTLGELGLFYALSPIAYIGRSLSNDGGGGHNPIEATQLGCAVIHGPNVQNLKDIYDQIHKNEAALLVNNQRELEDTLYNLINDKYRCAALQRAASSFAKEKSRVINSVMNEIIPQLDSA